MRTCSPACAALLVLLWLPLAAPLAAQLDDRRPLRPPVVERVYHLSRRPAAAAVDKVCPLLSPRGSVEVQDGGRTLVVRDLEPIVERAVALLAAFDRGGRTLRLAVQIVSAEAGAGGAVGAAALELPAEVVERLHRLLRYRTFAVLARAELEAREEEDSSFEVGGDFRVSFRLDRLDEPERVRIRDFRVLRRTIEGELKPLVQTHLSLEVGRPMILGLSPTETSERALMVVLEAQTDGASQGARG